MRSFICIAFLYFFQSCNTDTAQKEPFRSVLVNCDEVEIVLYNNGDTLSYQTKDTAGIKIFSGLIKGTGNQTAAVCAPTGELRYKAKAQTILTAQFSLSKSGSKEDCDHVSYRFNNENYHHKITKRALNLLQQTYSLTPVQEGNKQQATDNKQKNNQ